MDLDLDALRQETLKITLGGKDYSISQLSVDKYLSVLHVREQIDVNDPSGQMEAIRKIICGLAPELPKESLGDLSVKQLYTLMAKLDAFQGGVGEDDVGNAPGGGGSR